MIKLTMKMPKFKKLTRKEINEAGNILLEDLKATVPVDTGTLRRGIVKKLIPNGIEFYIKGKRNNEVASYLIDGTDDHFVAPRRKKALAFVGSDGRVHFSSGHWVSGIRKGLWKFKPRAKAIQAFERRINILVKAK